MFLKSLHSENRLAGFQHLMQLASLPKCCLLIDTHIL
jgi:hypothetical protein